MPAGPNQQSVILQGYATTSGSQTPVTPVYVLQPDQILEFFDSLATLLKVSYRPMGLGAPAETTSITHAAQEARVDILGDGSAQHPGIGSPQWQAQVMAFLDQFAMRCRYDTFFAQLMRPLLAAIEDLLKKNLPTGWTFVAPGGVAHFLDAHLLRLNACSTATPPKPGAAGTLTAITDPLGALPSTVMGAAPRVLHTLVGTLDYMESLPGTEAAQVALTGTQNAYTYQIPGLVPDNIVKVRLYRSFYGNVGGGPYYWVKDVSVVPGQTYPAIPLYEPDVALRQDWSPPAWMQCLLVPEEAALVAMAYAVVNVAPGGSPQPLQFSALTMLSPANAVLGPANGFIGVGNPVQSAQYGVAVVGDQFYAGHIQTENNADLNVQGFLGGFGVQARILSPLNGTRVPTISYTYLDAGSGVGNPQTQSGLAPAINFPNGNVGSLAVWTVPAGRVVLSVTEESATGSATGGSYCYEAPQARPY